VSVRIRTAPLLAIGLLVAALAAPAFSATTVEVGTCIPNLVHFDTIQDAVNAAGTSGTTIDVCPGNYPEQVVINKNLALKGVADPSSNQDAAVVISPADGVVANTTSLSSGQPIAAQILVTSPATAVSISNMTVDGSGNNLGDCTTNLIGVYFQNASGSVATSVLRNQALAPSLSGCQDGLGVFVQSGGGGASTVTVQESSVHDYDKNGITGNEAGTTLNVLNNAVQGFGVVNPPGAAQNGIQLGFGATGRISGNTVIDHVYGDITQAIATGILLFDTQENSGITVSSNNVHNSQGAVVMVTDTPGSFGDGVSVQSNTIFEVVNFDAIDACTNNNTIKSNTIANSSQSAIHLDSSCSGTGNGNTVNGNIMLESACAGILQDTGTSDSIGSNLFVDIPFTVLNGSCPGTPGRPGNKRLARPHAYR